MCVTSVLFNDVPLTEPLYHAARADNYVMVVMVFLQLVHQTDDLVKMNLVGHNPWMLRNVYKGMLFLSPDAVVRFALAARV